MMRVLVISPEVAQSVQRIVDFASDRSNWYHPSAGDTRRPSRSRVVPGDDPRHVLMLDTYRCVFSFTAMDNKVYRHLSVSVPAEGERRPLPSPIAFNTIAQLFGFPEMGTEGYHVAHNEGEGCIVAVMPAPQEQES